MLRKHLSQYSDEELSAEIKRHVDEQVPESRKLDYKQEVALDSKKERREVAKDISSFANEIGGAVIYGIPEDRQSDEIAVPTKPYGIEPIPQLESRLENVCIDTIAPRLPDLQIRKVGTEYQGRVVYVVWHPESWLAPHMVEGYVDHRYYRRGRLRAVKMDEHDVRQKYAQSEAQLDRVKVLLESRYINFLVEVAEKSKTQFVCCPVMLAPDRVDFSSSRMRRWLEENQWLMSYHRWRPSFHGVCASREYATEPSLQGRYCEIHGNGAVNYWENTPLLRPEELSPPLEPGREPFVSVRRVLGRLEGFLTLCAGLYKKIGYFQPVAVRLRITKCSGFGFSFSDQSRFTAAEPITRYAIRGNSLQVDRTVSGAELVSAPDTVKNAVFEPIYRAFGFRAG